MSVVNILMVIDTAKLVNELTAQLKDYQERENKIKSAIVAGTVWAFSEMGASGDDVAWVMAILVPLSGVLMVSNFQYHSFKGLDLKGKVPFVAMLAVVMGFVVVSIDPAKVLLGIFMAYAFSGPVVSGWQYMKARRQ